MIWIPILLAAASAAAAAAAANAQNKASRASMGSVNQARAIGLEQAQSAANIERMKRKNQSLAILGRLAVSAAERGVGNGGTVEALERAEVYNANLDDRLIDTNQRFANARIESETSAAMAQLMATRVNPLLAAFSGGLSGASAGINIGGLIGDGDGGNGDAGLQDGPNALTQ